MEEIKVNKRWQRAELEIVKLDTADIITTSNTVLNWDVDPDKTTPYETQRFDFKF